jgi:hypothetical protein
MRMALRPVTQVLGTIRTRSVSFVQDHLRAATH